MNETASSTSPLHLHLHPDTVSQRTDEGLVVVNLHTYDFVELDDVGGSMWEALRATGDVDAAAARLAAEYDAPLDEITADLAEFVEHLRQAGLVIDAEAADDVPGAPTDDGPAMPGSAHDDALGHVRDLYLETTARAICGLTAHNRGRDEMRQRFVGAPDDLRHFDAVSLIGLPRLRHLRALVERVLSDGVPGDLMECGVWRGGAVIMMRATLAAHGVTDRAVWLADSFQGLPTPDTDAFPLDREWAPIAGRLDVTADEVRRNIEAFGLLDHSVRFLEGWFADTLPTAPVEQLAVLRLDGDLQESTQTALDNLYHRVSPGGYVVIDDYCFDSCRAAVDRFRADHGITSPLHHIDWCATFWQVPTA